jgi:hypothetical protein
VLFFGDAAASASATIELGLQFVTFEASAAESVTVPAAAAPKKLALIKYFTEGQILCAQKDVV